MAVSTRTSEERGLLVQALLDAREAGNRNTSVGVLKTLYQYHGGYTDFASGTKTPADGAIEVHVDAIVTMVFNQDMTVVSLADVTIKKTSDGTPVTGVSATLGGNKRTVTIAHDNFANLTEYIVTVPTRVVKNAYGVGNKQTQWSFTTEAGT